MTDLELLQRYGRDGAEDAFAALVRRHADLVYSAARRQVSVPHLAEDVTQAAFIELARAAPRWRPDQPVGAWLLVVTRRAAIDAMRRESRRAARERATLDTPPMPSSEDSWNDIRPLLDAAVAGLGEHDRTAIVGRFFENKNLRDVARDLGASEDAAQKRIGRALDRLRAACAARGITVTTVGLAGTLAAQAVQPAPPALVAQLVASATIFSEAVTAGSAAKISCAKIVATVGGIGAGAVAVGLALVLVHQHTALAETGARFTTAEARIAALRRDRDADRERLRVAQPGAPAPLAPDPDAALRAEAQAWNERLAHLKSVLQHRPDLALPELALLSDDDWREVTRERPFSTDRDVGNAILELRNSARSTFRSA